MFLSACGVFFAGWGWRGVREGVTKGGTRVVYGGAAAAAADAVMATLEGVYAVLLVVAVLGLVRAFQKKKVAFEESHKMPRYGNLGLAYGHNIFLDAMIASLVESDEL